MHSHDKNPRLPHIKIPRLEALLKKEVLLERVAELDSQLATELRAVDATLAVYETTQGTRYAKYRSTSKAVIASLESIGRWSRPREIARDLAEGGFVMDPANGPRLIVDACRLMVDGEKLKRLGDYVGLPSWPVDPNLSEK